VAEHQAQDRQADSQGKERMKDLKDEVDPVLQLVHRPHSEEQQSEAGNPKRLRPLSVCHPPTAE